MPTGSLSMGYRLPGGGPGRDIERPMNNSRNIQWLSENDGRIGVFRYGAGFNKHGDPYELSCTIQQLPEGGLRLFGATSNFKKNLLSHRREIRNILLDAGVTFLLFERLQADKSFKDVFFKL